MAMKKFINNPADVAKELTTGMVKAYSNYLKLIEDDIIILAPILRGDGRRRPGPLRR